jgi:serine/threonine protein kinase
MAWWTTPPVIEMLGNVTRRFEPGSAFAGYRIESLAGRGGMGVVYQATDLSLDRPVALKLIAPELADDPRFRERFLEEPRLAASLDHSSVISIYEAGEHDGQLYLAMRYVQGSDLRTLLQREGALAPERALAILGQIAGALDAAHRRASSIATSSRGTPSCLDRPVRSSAAYGPGVRLTRREWSGRRR